jgi:hypothetical protein
MNSRLPDQVLTQHGGGALQVVGGAAQDRIRTEEGSVGERARRPVRHAEAPGVDDAAAVGEAVERHMRVAADDHPLLDADERIGEPRQRAVD